MSPRVAVFALLGLMLAALLASACAPGRCVERADDGRCVFMVAR